MDEVVEKSMLEMLEENFEAAKKEIRELDHQAWSAMKTLNDKTGSSGEFDLERYRHLKKRLQDTCLDLETKLRRERIHVLQERRVELQKELTDIQPEQLKTKALVHEAQKLLDEAWQNHARLDLKAASLESQLGINFSELRNNQRALQELIKTVTGLEDLDDGPSANTENLLIRN
jgi:chromosome segregation ATPase